MTDITTRPQEVLDFWFGDGLLRDWPTSDRNALWFGGGAAQDALITQNFGALVESALGGGLHDWEAQLASRLALIVVLDQFTRNIFRGQARAFAGDGRAQQLVLQSLALAQDAELPRVGRVFLYMPLMHAERLELQDECVARFTHLLATTTPELRDTLAGVPGTQAVRTAPLVLGRLVAVNGAALRESGDTERDRESRDEHKLSDRSGNFDDVVIDRGAWWPQDHSGEPLVAMEDREADELGLKVGDRLRFEIMGTPVEATLAAIYSQRRMQSRLWLEAIFSDGVLDPHITRHVGAAYLGADGALAAQDALAAVAPNIATVRTESLLRETRALMARASGGLALVAGVCLAASLLVLASVVASSRARQVYDATVMHALGARHGTLRQVLYWEYALLALVTAGFAMLAGGALATGLLRWRLDLDPSGLYWTGALTAMGVAAVSLGLGARYLLAQMRLSPALLLRSGA